MKRILALLLTAVMTVILLPANMSGFALAESAALMPEGLARIRDEAFAGDGSLDVVVIPNTVTSIGSRAFAGCIGITEVTVGSHDITIADDAFADCGKDIVFYTHDDSPAASWALAHGFRCESLDDGSGNRERFEKLLSYSGMSSEVLMGAYASRCLIVRTGTANRMPDISQYHPVDIYRSDSNLFYIQFATEGEAEDCANMLLGSSGIVSVEPDRGGEDDSVSAQGVTIAGNWGTDDTMGFDVYAPYVASKTSGSITVAVIDSGVSKSSWGGKFSSSSASFVDGDAYSDSVRHGSKVASIISDCLGENASRATLLSVKVVNSSARYRTSVIIEGLKHAIDRGADIINMSLGWDISEGISPEIAYQISRANGKGIMVVAAAGNGSGGVMFPATCSGVLAVSALAYSKSNGYSVRSRTGSEVDYTAPGMYLGTKAFPNIDSLGDNTGTASTSFAAPQITAALALIKLDPDPTRSGSPLSTLNSCCETFENEGLSSRAYGRGMPQLRELVIVKTISVTLENMDGGDIPRKMWIGEDFMLGWKIEPADASDKTVTITADNNDVLALRQYGSTFALVTAKSVGEATVTVTSGEVSTAFTVKVEKPVTSVAITGAQEELVVGYTLQLGASLLPEDATNSKYEWRTSDSGIAEVSESGLVTAIKPGNVRITCAALDGYGAEAHADITVIDIPEAESITLTSGEKDIASGSVTLEVGEVITLQAVVSPEKALQEVSYDIFPLNVATVSENGIIRAVAPGTATVIATASTGKNIRVYLAVTVVVMPESVSISAAKNILDIGETLQLSASVLPSDTTDKTVVWESRNTAVLTVNSATGLVSAIAPGTTVITCTTANGRQDSVTIAVRQPITITFDANEGVCGETARTAYSGYKIGVLPTPVRTYWTFDGWYNQKDGGTRASESSVYTKDTVLYAHWAGKPYTVAFDANGGSCETDTLNGTVGSRLGVLPEAEREYYSFVGWYTAKDGGNEVTADYVQMTDSAITLYAHWDNNPYRITFNANGGTCDTTQKNAVVNKAIGALPVPARDFYIFDGWFTAMNGGTQITETYVQTTTDALTLYAHWTGMTYTLSFDANGGSCEETERLCTVDTAIGTLPVPERPFYTFLGWYTAPEDGTHVTEAYTHPSTETLKLYACWAPETYTVSFDANGGTCDTAGMTGTVDTPLGELPEPKRDYYTFTGWYDKAEAGNKVDSEYVQSTDADITLYAHWNANAFTYHTAVRMLDGTLVTEDRTGHVDEAITLPACKAEERKYYTFKGWFTQESGGTRVETLLQSTDDELTLYAQWTPMTYKVTFNANGGTCGTASATVNVDTAIGTLPAASKEYYTFVGWFTQAEGGVQITTKYTQSANTALTLYAHYTPLQYTAKFNANGGTMTGDSNRQYYVDTPMGTLPADPTRPYYTFNGWYTAQTGGTRVSVSTKFTTTSAVTLYAQWIPYNFTLKFNAQGGSCSESTRTCSVDTPIGTLPTPTRSYYTFDGWYDAASGGTKIGGDKTYPTNASVTLYAHWTPKTMKVTFNANGGSCGTASMTGTVDKALGTLPIPVRDCYRFDGWYDSQSGGNKWTSSSKPSTDSAFTLYAHWTAYSGMINVPSGTIKEDTAFLCKGTVETYQRIKSVTGGVYQGSTCVLPLSYSMNGSDTSFRLQDTPFYYGLNLYTLEPGSYTFKLLVNSPDSSTPFVIANNSFTITEYTGSTSLRFENVEYLKIIRKATLANGVPTKGKVYSDAKITSVTGTIIRSDKKEISPIVKLAPNTTSFDLASKSFDEKVLFTNCTELKKYCYYLTVTDAKNRTLELKMVLETKDVSKAEWAVAERRYMEPILVKQIVSSGSIYLYYSSTVNWSVAKSFAESLGGHLAIITSATENSLICSNSPISGYAWIGGSKNSSGIWNWTNGTSLGSYSNWSSGEPNNAYGIEQYIAMKGDGTWNDDCNGDTNIVGFIVEIPR